MNPLYVDLLGSLIRWLLASAVGWFVAHGIWTQDQAATAVAVLATAIVSLGWTLWKTYGKRLKIVTALALPSGCTERDVEAQIANPILAIPSVTTPKDVAPTIAGQ